MRLHLWLPPQWKTLLIRTQDPVEVIMHRTHILTQQINIAIGQPGVGLASPRSKRQKLAARDCCTNNMWAAAPPRPEREQWIKKPYTSRAHSRLLVCVRVYIRVVRVYKFLSICPYINCDHQSLGRRRLQLGYMAASSAHRTRANLSPHVIDKPVGVCAPWLANAFLHHQLIN